MHFFVNMNVSCAVRLIYGPTVKCGLDLRTGLGKIVHNAFQYSLHLFWNHPTHLIRITGIACAFESHFAHYGVL